MARVLKLFKFRFRREREGLFTKTRQEIQCKVQGLGTYSVGLQELQKGAINNEFIHISLHILNSNEITHLTVPIYFIGKARAPPQVEFSKKPAMRSRSRDIQKIWWMRLKLMLPILLGHNFHVKDLVVNIICSWPVVISDKLVVCFMVSKIENS